MSSAKRIIATVLTAVFITVLAPTATAVAWPVAPGAIALQKAQVQKAVTTQAPLSREEAASQSRLARDMRGPAASAYHGIYYHADQEWFRRCVAAREGSWTYMVRGGGGGNYYGTYQFHRNFQRGAAYMMASESRRTHDGLRKDALRLRYVPINKWSRYWQDRAFYTVLNFNGRWTGKHHWNGGRWHC